jgi:hypothetical protein
VLTVPLRSKRRERAKVFQKAQHAVPAMMLLGAGVHALSEERSGFGLALAVFEIASSVLLLVAVARAIRKVKQPANRAHVPHPHYGVDWIDIFAGSVLIAEAIEHWHLTHHVQRPTILTAVVLLTIGLLHGRIVRRFERRFTIHVGEDDLYVGGKPFRRIHAKWADVASIDIGPRFATIRTRAGRQRKLDLSDLEGSDHVRGALEEARRRLVTGHEAKSAPP